MNEAARANDLDLKEWKQYTDILTDSLWLIDSRDKTGGHSGGYHGNFVPQIPNQLIRRFTCKEDVILDAFLGSGTTLIESRRLGRRGIGIELLPEVADLAKSNLSQSSLLDQDVPQEVILGDSTHPAARVLVDEALHKWGANKVKLVILHPPYHDIIKFSDDARDLSNARSVKDFIDMFGRVVDNFLDVLTTRGHVAVVIGDKYTGSEWVPLGSYVISEVLKRPGIKLKSIIVKNMVNNRAKRNQEQLWRYRALMGGFYVFRHEYILLFQKV